MKQVAKGSRREPKKTRVNVKWAQDVLKQNIVLMVRAWPDLLGSEDTSVSRHWSAWLSLSCSFQLFTDKWTSLNIIYTYLLRFIYKYFYFWVKALAGSNLIQAQLSVPPSVPVYLRQKYQFPRRWVNTSPCFLPLSGAPSQICGNLSFYHSIVVGFQT